MSTDGNTSRIGRPLSRRDFLVLGGAGVGALAFGGYAARIAEGQATTESFYYRGKKVVVKQRNGNPELSIDGEPIPVVDTNGTYRAAGYAFDWASTPKGLAKKIVDNEALLKNG